MKVIGYLITLLLICMGIYYHFYHETLKAIDVTTMAILTILVFGLFKKNE